MIISNRDKTHRPEQQGKQLTNETTKKKTKMVMVLATLWRDYPFLRTVAKITNNVMVNVAGQY